jgi:predicted metal-dependent TIM-barrel fold hydrolase
MNKTYNDMWLCHTDYLDVQVRDENMPLKVLSIIKKEDLDPKLYVIDHGKHEGKNLVDIYFEDPRYIDYLRDTSEDVLLKQCIKNI